MPSKQQKKISIRHSQICYLINIIMKTIQMYGIHVYLPYRNYTDTDTHRDTDAYTWNSVKCLSLIRLFCGYYGHYWHYNGRRRAILCLRTSFCAPAESPGKSSQNLKNFTHVYFVSKMSHFVHQTFLYVDWANLFQFVFNRCHGNQNSKVGVFSLKPDCASN